MKQYDIYSGEETVGQAYVDREGLYYRIHCRCILASGVMHRVVVCCGEAEENLGILVPEGDRYMLTKRIPIKRLGSGEFRFYAMPKRQKTCGTFVSVYPDEPFAYIRQLENSCLARMNGRLGIILR